MADTHSDRRGLKQWLLLFLKAMVMGAADTVPGVSGGTIAVITHIYDELIFSLRAISTKALGILFSQGVAPAWVYINGSFLLVVLLGIMLSLLLSARTVLLLLESHYEPLMAFFIGLVLASSWFLRSQFQIRQWQTWVFLLAGMAFLLAVTQINPQTGNFSLMYLFFCGLVAICAMILPGLSGAFLLLVLGVYDYMLSALLDFNWPVILVFVLGCVLGLLSFSRLLAWILARFHALTYAFLTGMLIASVWVIWPWKQALSYYTDSAGQMHSLQTVNLLPTDYLSATNQDPRILLVSLSFIAGLLLIAAFEKLFARLVDD
jgi:putative membrane protein